MKKILVIDDEPTVRLLVAKTLRKGGYEVREAEGGQQGLEAAQTWRPDLVLSDIMMSPVDGFALLESLRSQPATSGIPVILMTGVGDDQHMRQGMELGADDFLPKPFTGTALHDAVRARLERQQIIQEQVLRESERRYRELVNNQGEGVVFADENLRFTFANPAAEAIFDLGPGQLVGRALEEFLGEKEQAIIRKQREHREAGRKSNYEIEIITASHQRRQILVTATPQIEPTGKFCGTFAIFRDITERKVAEEKLRLQSSALQATLNGILITDRRGQILWVNAAFSRLTGYACDEVLGRTPSVLKSGAQNAPFYQGMWDTILGGHVWQGELVNRRKDGAQYHEEMTITPVLGDNGEILNFVAVKQDISQRKFDEKERHLMELQLRQSQKLEAIGQLAAGIAHEINTPTQYVGDNIRFLKEAFDNIVGLLRSHGELLAATKQNALTPALLARAEETLAASDMEYFYLQIPQAIAETLEGVDRVTKIVRAMKEFSHPGGREKSAANLNQAIESTVMVARNEWKYVAELKMDLDPALPLVPCFIGEFNQVILNLVVNAAQAIGEKVRQPPGTLGLITIQTRSEGDSATVRVSDNGPGIPECHRQRIFEPFFTTKEVGKGSGQGLAFVHTNIVKKHGGMITFETESGQGTTFAIRLPLHLKNPDPDPLPVEPVDTLSNP